MVVDSKLYYVQETKSKNRVTRSEWSNVIKRTPQGNILGPHVFNIFQNDLIYWLNSQHGIYNYVEDNTVEVYVKWHSTIED